MAKALSVTQMNKFESMLQEDFRPVLHALEAHERAAEEIASFQVRQELGLLDLLVKQKELELSLEEVKKQIYKMETKEHKDGEYISTVGRAIKAKLSENAAGPIAEVRATHKHLLRQIRLACVPDDVKSIFETLPATVAALTASVKRLPAPKRPKAMLKAKKDKII
jgi:hypothetical protein